MEYDWRVGDYVWSIDHSAIAQIEEIENQYARLSFRDDEEDHALLTDLRPTRTCDCGRVYRFSDRLCHNT